MVLVVDPPTALCVLCSCSFPLLGVDCGSVELFVSPGPRLSLVLALLPPPFLSEFSIGNYMGQKISR